MISAALELYHWWWWCDTTPNMIRHHGLVIVFSVFVMMAVFQYYHHDWWRRRTTTTKHHDSGSTNVIISNTSSIDEYNNNNRKELVTPNEGVQKHKPPNVKKKLRGPICPFSAESDFLVEMMVVDDASPLHPLDLFADWIDPMSAALGRKPLAARWLNAGLSGQDTPGRLRAGLKRLSSSQHFLVEDPYRMREELLLKATAFDERNEQVLVQESVSLNAQQECLELLLSYLPKRYPDLYHYNVEERTLYVVPLDRLFRIDEWRNDRPLELCCRIVQEDLCLMRPPRSNHDDDNNNKNQNQYCLSAAGVVFSFQGLPERLGQPVALLHAPVPGYEKHLRKTMDLTFAKLLKVEHPLWRNNWGIDPLGRLDEPLYGVPDDLQKRSFTASTTSTSSSREEMKSKFLKVEYETIRRLPRSGHLLFTIKSMIDPLQSLEEVPRAAACLAASIRGMSAEMRRYKGIADPVAGDALLSYLDEISRSSKNDNDTTTTE